MRPVLALAAVVLPLTACGGPPDAGDYRAEAEDFIEETDSELTAKLGTTFTDATCEEPSSTDIGTSFTCTATDATGTTVQFPVEIVGERQIAVSDPVAPSVPPTATPTTTIAG